MEGLKPMVNKAMGDDDNHVPPKTCDSCGKWIEPGNTGTVCGACTQSMLGMGASTGGSFQPLGTYAANPNDYGASNLTPNSHVGLGINGHNLHVTVFRSLQGLADDITNSMLPDQVDMLVSLLKPPVHHPSYALPDDFWDAIKAGHKIPAIKELRTASNLNLRSAKDIVDAIMNKPEDKDDKDKSEDKDKSDDSGDKPEESEPDDTMDPSEYDQDDPDFNQYPDDYDGEADGDADGADAGEGDAEGDGDDNGQDESSTATADAIADLARKAHDNGKNHSEDEIREALKTLGIQF